MQTHEEPRSNWGVWVLVLALIFTCGVSFAYLFRARRQASELSANNQTLTATLTQLQKQLDDVTGRLNSLQSARRPATVSLAKAVGPVGARQRTFTAPRPAEDSRVTQLRQQVQEQQSRIADQQKEIADARQELQQTRGDLQSNLDSARTELSGSIARTHDELVALQKRGERNYFEFQIDKSKVFRRVGPLSLSLRKADVKRKSYDLAMVVDDNQLQKKNVNLYEPVWLNLADKPEPVELVVNQISKNEIKGYVSEPKYKKTELDASISPAAAEPQ